MQFPIRGRLSLLLAAALALAALPAVAAEPAAADAEQVIEPRVRELLSSSLSGLAKRDAFAVNIVTKMKTNAGPFTTDMEFKQVLQLARPNRLSIVSSAGPMEEATTLICDGKHVYQYVGFMNKYTLTEADDGLGAIAENPFLAAGGIGAAQFLPAMLSPDGYEKFAESIVAGKYVAAEELNGHKVHHLHLDADQMEWEVWLDADPQGLLRKAIPDMAKILEQIAKQGDEQAANMKMEVTVQFQDWNLKPKFTDADFKIEPREDAEKVDSLFDGFQDEGEAAPHALLGEAAPGFELDQVGGKRVSLKRHANKDVVILDFWATWCGPCRAAMPTLAKVAKKYEGKGVVLYGVNIQEDAETIEEFLKEQKFKLQVLRDTEGAVAGEYLVEGIPQTVLIGKDGVVHSVHIGLLPDLETRLTDEIDALLQGENLAAKTLAEHKKQSDGTAAEDEEGADQQIDAPDRE